MRDLGLAPGQLLTDHALVDARNDRAFLHEIAHIEAQLDNAARNLRRNGRLLHRLDQAFCRISLIDFAKFDCTNREWQRSKR